MLAALERYDAPDDVQFGNLPFGDCRFPSDAPFEERRDLHDHTERADTDINAPIIAGVLRHFIQIYWQVGWHIHSPELLSEQLGKKRRKLALINSRLLVNSEADSCFLPTAANARRADSNRPILAVGFPTLATRPLPGWEC